MGLSPEILNQLRLPPQTEGVVVTRVDRRSPAGLSGLGRGDVILEVNRKPVRSLRDFQRLTDELEKGSTVLLVNRQGRIFYMTISVGR